jgi:superfamily II DNA helicase RecQ
MHAGTRPAAAQVAGGGRGPVTVVVSPLVSLVHDQVTALNNRGVRACALKASLRLQCASGQMV